MRRQSKTIVESAGRLKTDGGIVAAPARGRRILWLATAAVAGLVVMMLELAAFRLYAPYFGYSIYVWGSMIGVVMGGLALGYALGGWAADVRGEDRWLYVGILLSAAYQGVMCFAAREVLQFISGSGEIAGPVLATVVVFVPSMALLAGVGPFVIRLLARGGHVGSAAGTVYALSTVGSVAGVFATSFWLVPTFGTQVTLAVASGITAVAALAGLVFRSRVAAAAAAIPLIVAVAPMDFRGAGTVWAEESAYNFVRVVERGGVRMLILNQDRGAHSVPRGGSPWTGMYYDAFAIGPALVPARRALVLGMGGGGSIEALRAAAPEVRIDAVEIDPRVVYAARRFFELPADDERLTVHIADARPWLMRNGGIYDIVQVDLYQGGPYVPFYLATVEFFQLVRAHLSEEGVVMMNLLDASSDHALLDEMVATLRAVYPSVAVLPCERGSYLLCAFPTAREVGGLREQLVRAGGAEMVQRLAREAAARLYVPEKKRGCVPFTDDLSPIEEMTRRMLAEIHAQRENGPGG